MVKFSNREDFFIIKGNNESSREYVYIKLSELITSPNKKSHEIDYTNKNVRDWPIIADPAEIIVESGEEVKVKILKNYPDSENDRIFGLTFIPDTINSKEDKKYNISFGYKTWFVIPSNAPMVGTLSAYKGNKLGDYAIKNDTNKVMEVTLDYCNQKLSGKEDKCTGQLIAAPYSTKNFSLGKDVNSVEIKFYLGGSSKKEPVKKVTI